MRILLVTSFGFPHLGGLSKYMHLLKRGLEGRGHYVEVLSLDTGWRRYRLLKQGKYIHKTVLDNYIVRTNYRGFRQQVTGMPTMVRGNELRRRGLELAARRFGIGGFDVIHAQDITAAMAMAKLGLRRTKLVTTLHGSMAGEMIGSIRRAGHLRPAVWKYVFSIEHFGAIASDRVIVPSAWLKNIHRNIFETPRSRMVIVPHGTHSTGYTPKLAGRNSSTPIIFNGQRLEAVKGHRYMLKALSQLKRYRWKAQIAGSGSQRRALEQIRNRYGIRGRVTFLGTRRDVPALLRKADIAVVPSLVETFGFSAVEAQLAGVPVVGFKTSGITELIVHGRTGYLVPAGNSAKLAEYIGALLKNPDLRRRMGKAARARALNLWTLQRMISNTIRIYNSSPNCVYRVPPDNLMSTSISTSAARLRLRRLASAYMR